MLVWFPWLLFKIAKINKNKNTALNGKALFVDPKDGWRKPKCSLSSFYCFKDDSFETNQYLAFVAKTTSLSFFPKKTHLKKKKTTEMIQAMFHSALVTNVQVIGPLSNKYMEKKTTLQLLMKLASFELLSQPSSVTEIWGALTHCIKSEPAQMFLWEEQQHSSATFLACVSTK